MYQNGDRKWTTVYYDAIFRHAPSPNNNNNNHIIIDYVDGGYKNMALPLTVNIDTPSGPITVPTVIHKICAEGSDVVKVALHLQKTKKNRINSKNRNNNKYSNNHNNKKLKRSFNTFSSSPLQETFKSNPRKKQRINTSRASSSNYNNNNNRQPQMDSREQSTDSNLSALQKTTKRNNNQRIESDSDSDDGPRIQHRYKTRNNVKNMKIQNNDNRYIHIYYILFWCIYNIINNRSLNLLNDMDQEDDSDEHDDYNKDPDYVPDVDYDQEDDDEVLMGMTQKTPQNNNRYYIYIYIYTIYYLQYQPAVNIKLYSEHKWMQIVTKQEMRIIIIMEYIMNWFNRI